MKRMVGSIRKLRAIWRHRERSMGWSDGTRLAQPVSSKRISSTTLDNTRQHSTTLFYLPSDFPLLPSVLWRLHLQLFVHCILICRPLSRQAAATMNCSCKTFGHALKGNNLYLHTHSLCCQRGSVPSQHLELFSNWDDIRQTQRP
jgi:hypothetical protein